MVRQRKKPSSAAKNPPKARLMAIKGVNQKKIDEINALFDKQATDSSVPGVEDIALPGFPEFEVQYSAGRSLGNDIKAEIFLMVEDNMKDLYSASSWGWDPLEKKTELFSKTSRYFLVRERGSSGIVAFVHFRFVVEGIVDSLYVYELQVKERMQRKGLGRFLMERMEAVARAQTLRFVLLTVFKKNSKAMAFYKEKLNYDVDLSSPSLCERPDEDYEILSRCFDENIQKDPVYLKSLEG